MVGLFLIEMNRPQEKVVVAAPNYDVYIKSVSSIRGETLRQQGQEDQCRFYLTQSAIPDGGLGVFFTAIVLHTGDMVVFLLS